MNQLLESLPQDAFRIIEPHLERVALRPADVLYFADQRVDHVHFPTGGLVSIVVVMNSGQTAETSLVGRDGMVCSAVVLDVQDAIDQATVEIPTEAFRIRTEPFIAAYRKNEALRTSVNRYHALLIAESRQSTACNALHNAEQRLCRWLADACDRTGSDELPLTQEFLGRMLGLRRSTVTEIYAVLQAQGLVSLTRGHTTILNPQALRNRACECYGILKIRITRIFPDWAVLRPALDGTAKSALPDPLPPATIST